MNNERENYSWGIIQDMIEKEISSAFKLREPSILLNENVKNKDFKRWKNNTAERR